MVITCHTTPHIKQETGLADEADEGAFALDGLELISVTARDNAPSDGLLRYDQPLVGQV